jgi:hypothetical protein
MDFGVDSQRNNSSWSPFPEKAYPSAAYYS